MSLLGSLVASAVQNIRAYESERRTVEELRRLSTMRADFVSLVSHELRSPMAAVIGAARTLQQRWRELSARAARGVPRADRRRDDAARGADRRRARHVAHRRGHVHATASRTSTSPGSSRDSVATATRRPGRGAARRDASATCRSCAATAAGCGRCSANLIDNAVKYSPAGARGRGRRRARLNGAVVVAVTDHGPGIARRGPAADLREVRPRRGRRLEARHRPRPLHRALDRRGARRHARRRVGARRAARPSR